MRREKTIQGNPLQAQTLSEREKMENQTRSEMLAKERIGKLLYKLSLPSIMAMLVQAMYNIVDTIFVGKGVGTLGIGAIAVVFPMHMLIMASAQTISIGGASRISRRMGAGDMEGVALTFGNMLILAEIVGVTIMALGLIFMVPLLRLFGATEDILPYAIEYFQVLLLAVPILTFVINNGDAARAEGNAKVAMITMMTGAFLNMILDPIFIFGLDMGIRGAALATVISISASCLLLILYFMSGRSEIPVGIRYLRLKRHIIREILAVGSSSFAMAGAMSFTMALVYNTLRALGSSIEIAAFGIIHRMFSLIFMPVMGLSQGMQPIVGFNYGARQFHRVRHGVRLTGLTATVIATMGFMVMMLFPETIIGFFTKDPALLKVGREAIRYCAFGLPLAGLQIIGGGLFQALGKPIHALILTLSRQVLILIPLMFTLPHYIGIKGVWLSFPSADSLSFFLTLFFLIWVMKMLSANAAEQIPVAPSTIPVGHLPSYSQGGAARR